MQPSENPRSLNFLQLQETKRFACSLRKALSRANCTVSIILSDVYCLFWSSGCVFPQIWQLKRRPRAKRKTSVMLRQVPLLPILELKRCSETHVFRGSRKPTGMSRSTSDLKVSYAYPLLSTLVSGWAHMQPQACGHTRHVQEP